MVEREFRQNNENQSGRDGRKSYNNRDGYNRNNRYEGGNYGHRPNNTLEGTERQNRSSFNPRFNNGGERLQRGGYTNNNYNRSQRPYGNRSYGNNEGNERPAYASSRYNNNNDRPQRQFTPKFNSEGGEQRSFRSRQGQQTGYRQQNGGYGNGRQNGYRQRTADYNPNAKYSMKKQIEYKDLLTDPNEPIRLNKYLANAGICSRREADEFITAGVVSVNGVVVTELGTKVHRNDEVKFHDQLVNIERKVYLLLNKPKDCVTTSDDPQERKTVMDLVKNACKERIYPVGRLDRNTTGVLLLTNDGEMASKLTHPKYLKKKIYHVYCDKNVTKADLDQILQGVTLEDGEIHADAISYASDTDKSQVGIEIHSGKNRIVRRIFEHLGYKVIKLDRVYFAGLTKKGLRRGDWRFLTENEVNMLRMGSFE